MVAGGFLLLTMVVGIVLGVALGFGSPGGEVPVGVDPASINLAALLLAPLVAFADLFTTRLSRGYLGGRIGERYASGVCQTH